MTQTLILTLCCLAYGSGTLLASSYILNQPISINLSATWPMAHLCSLHVAPWAAGLVCLTPPCFPYLCSDFSSYFFYGACHGPKQLLYLKTDIHAYRKAFPYHLGVLYFLALVGNVTIIFIIWTDSSLHQPMYLFLVMLAAIDLVLASSTAPKALTVLLNYAHEIGYIVCLIQMFFIHAFSSMESGILVAMALDRYVAICLPLRHSTILHPGIIGRIGMVVLVRGLVLLIPFPILLQSLVFCRATVISHAYCEHMAVVKLACSETTVNRAYGLSVALLVVGLDVLAIGISYALILQAVLKVPGGEARLKAFSTCGSHVCVILIFYIPGMFSFLTHRFGHHVPHHVHVLLATLYLLVPPALNPLVHRVKTRQIHQRVLRVFYIKASS